ncbi:ATP-binding protein [Candidatus Moduliflexota bacterium]
MGNIFNPFYTTKSRGHGLGLALSQRIISEHGGRIDLQNRPGEGLTFAIVLPIPAGRAGGMGDVSNSEEREEKA